MAHGGEKERGWIPEPVRKAVRVKHSWNLVRLTFSAKVFNTSWSLESSGMLLWNTSAWFHTQRFWFNCSEVGPRHPKVFTAIQVILKGSQFNNYLRAGFPVLWCAEKSQRRHGSRRGLLWCVLCPAAMLAPCWVSLSLFSNAEFYLQPFSKRSHGLAKTQTSYWSRYIYKSVNWLQTEKVCLLELSFLPEEVQKKPDDGAAKRCGAAVPNSQVLNGWFTLFGLFQYASGNSKD